MNKSNATLSPEFLGQLSKVFVIERLGIRPEQHQLTTQGTWIRLAQRLINTPAPTKRNVSSKSQKQRRNR